METENKGVRFPVDLLERIEALAQTERRKFSQQVLYLCDLGLRVYEAKRGKEYEVLKEVAKTMDDAGDGRRAQ